MVTPTLESRLSFQTQQNAAFRQEYSPNINPNALEKDVQSYLGEYRFQVQKYDYELLLGTPLGGQHLLDIDDGIPLAAKAARAIERRVREGKNPDRERAELQGLINLENQLQYSNIGDEIIWISPPGPESDGYGDYGFIYLGKVGGVDGLGLKKHLLMSAIRVESPTLQQFNSALTALTGRSVALTKAEEFLASPIVVPGVWEDSEYVLSYIFNLKPQSEKDALFKRIVPLLSPYIQEFVDYVKQGRPKDFLFQAFQTIELLALDLIEEYSNTNSLQVYFIDRSTPLTFAMTHYQGQAPPQVAGSCGNTSGSASGLTSPNIFNKSSSLGELLSTNDDSKKEPFVCPKCGYETTKPVGDQCPSCKITKEEAVEKGYVTC